jgi:hypothetical protein
MRLIFAAATASLLFLSTQLRYTLSFSWSIPTEIRGIHSNLLNDEKKRDILSSLKQYQKTAGDHLTVIGFLASCNESLIANPNIIQKIIGGIQTLNEYLQDSGIQEELDAILNPRLADNIAILGVIQKQEWNGEDRRNSMLLEDMTMETFLEEFSLEEAAR